MSRIYVIHENREWVEPLLEALRDRDLPFAAWFLDTGTVDLRVPPPDGVFYNRMSASSHTRGHRYAPEHAAAALAQANKNGLLYILNRETGEPVHPIVETPVSTETARDGEQPWPTQPIPHTAAGEPMEPVSPIVPENIPPEHLEGNTIVPIFTPRGPDQIFAPGSGGGASYAPMAYSKQTGLLYVAAIDRPFNSGRGARGFASAFDPTTGELSWQQIFEGYGQSGPVVTAGGVVFVGAGSNTAGYFYAYDAATGEELWTFNTGAGVFSSPAVYMVDGEQFVTVASGGGSRGRRAGDRILSFALPPRRSTP